MNVMIVDDEVLMRTHIKYILENEIPAQFAASPYRLCGEAADGREALARIPACRPDVVLCDMRMPGMDGLALCEALHKTYPQIRFIALSNYDDYDYVRGTLQNGAVDYLLKHRLSAKELMQALAKAQQPSAREPIAQLNGNNTLVLRQEFLLHLLTGLYTDRQEVEARMQTLGLPLSASRLLQVVMGVDDYRTGNLRSSNLTNYSIVNIVSEILSDQKNGAICHVERGNYVILFSFAGTFSEKAINSTVHGALSRISTCMANFLNLSVSFSIGELCDDFRRLPEAYQAASEQLKNRFYQQPGGIVRLEEDVQQTEILNYFDVEKENTLVMQALNGDRTGVQQSVDALFEQIRKARPPLPVAQMTFTDLLGVLNRICKRESLDLQDLYPDGVLPEKHLSEMSSLSSVHQWFSELFERLCGMLQVRSAQPLSLYVRQAVQYIQTHFCEDISLSSAAEEVHVTPVYLSHLFKQELGIGFSEYLMQVRMKRAQLLLRQGKLSLRQVASGCGFQNYTYFLKAFKKQTGRTPKEFQREASHPD